MITGTDILSLTPNEYGDLLQQLETNLEEILHHFANYTDSILESLQNKNVSVPALHTYLLGLPAFLGKCDNKKLTLLSSKMKRLEEANDLCSIFKILKTECTSFLNYRIFEFLIKKYNIDRDDNLKYPEKLQKYVKRHKITEFIEIEPQLCDLTDDTKELILVLDIEATCRVSQLTDLGKAVAKIIGIKQSALLIHNIKECCVVVTFLIPANIADVVFTGDKIFSHDQQVKFQMLSVRKLSCNGFTIDLSNPNLGKLSSELNMD